MVPADDDAGLEGLDVHPPKRMVVGPSGRIYSSTSLCCLRVADQPRKAAIHFVEARLFDPVILLTILANCMTMAWESPLDPPGTLKAHFIDGCEWIFLFIFTGEMLAKIVAYGFLANEHAYLRDAWCQLDFVVVSLAWLPILVPSMSSANSIRSVRALRPLRALKRMPGMPVLVDSILSAIPKLGNVVFLCAFLLVVLGIMGTGLFKGTLHYRCARPGYVEPAIHPYLSGTGGPTALNLPAAASADRSSHPLGLRAANKFDTGIFCDPSARTATSVCTTALAGAGATCMYFADNPNADTTSFDSFSATSIVILQSLTFDEFMRVCYAVMDATRTPLVVAFWLVIVLFGGFFLVNLFLAVLYQVAPPLTRTL